MVIKYNTLIVLNIFTERKRFLLLTRLYHTPPVEEYEHRHCLGEVFLLQYHSHFLKSFNIFSFLSGKMQNQQQNIIAQNKSVSQEIEVLKKHHNHGESVFQNKQSLLHHILKTVKTQLPNLHVNSVAKKDNLGYEIKSYNI